MFGAAKMGREWDGRARILTLASEHDKTHQERKIPIPADLAKRLDAVAGKDYLWDRYGESLRQTDAPRVRDGFSPKRLYWAVRRVFTDFARQHPDRTKITPHDLRGRAITLTVEKTQSIDATAEALHVSAGTVKRHYLDRQRAFKTQELLKQMASVLVLPPTTEKK